jgi:hypothetical protein
MSCDVSRIPEWPLGHGKSCRTTGQTDGKLIYELTITITITITFLADCLAMSGTVLQELANEESAFKQLVDWMSNLER